MHPTKTLWDSKLSTRIIVNVLEARNLKTLKLTEPKSPAFRLSHGKTKVKTGKLEAQNKCNEIFAIDFLPETPLKIKAVDGSDVFGTGLLEINSLNQNIVFDRWTKLTANTKTKKKEQSQEIVTGEVHLLIYITNKPEERPPFTHIYGDLTCDETFRYYLDELYPKGMFKSGDLVLFSESGVIPVYTKVKNNIQFSNVGLVIALPNKFTKRKELFIFEIGKNHSLIPDAFGGRPIFNLPTLTSFDDRVYGHYGDAIWIMQLNRKLSDTEEMQLTNWIFGIWEEYFATISESDEEKAIKSCSIQIPTFSLPEKDLSFLESFGVKNRNRLFLSDLICPTLLAMAFHTCGIHSFSAFNGSNAFLSIVDLIKTGIFQQGKLIRVPKKQLNVMEIMNNIVSCDSIGESPIFEPRSIASQIEGPLPIPEDVLLPEGWETRKDENGRLYYSHPSSQRTQWFFPYEDE